MFVNNWFYLYYENKIFVNVNNIKWVYKLGNLFYILRIEF